MTLAFGRKILAIPGPTTVPDEVLQAMHRPAIDIYAGELEATTERIQAALRRAFRTEDARIYVYIANGHGGWEGALANTLSRGDRVLVLESGRFAVGWGEMAAAMGAEVEVLAGRPTGGVDPEAARARLAQDMAAMAPERRFKAVLIAQIDTASSAWSDVRAVRAAIDAAGHDALFMVDGVASIGCVPFEMDAWGVDLAMTGSQKGLMTPPGLAFVAAGPRAVAAMAQADLRTQYWDWEFREGPLHYHKYCGTPPEHLMFGLDRALKMLLEEEGLEAAWRRHAALAAATRAAVSAWAEGGALSFLIEDPAARGDTVTFVCCAEGYDAEALRAMTRDRLGVTLGVAIGDIGGPGGGFRIAHMGHVNAPAQLGVLGAIETAMRALGWPGAAGGLDAAADALAQALRAAD